MCEGEGEHGLVPFAFCPCVRVCCVLLVRRRALGVRRWGPDPTGGRAHVEGVEGAEEDEKREECSQKHWAAWCGLCVSVVTVLSVILVGCV